MSNNTRRITRRSFAEQRPPTELTPDRELRSLIEDADAHERTRARQTGKSVKSMRDEQTRFEAADVLQRLLDEDKLQRLDVTLAPSIAADCFLLSTEQRHALHVAVGALRKRGKP